MNTKEIFGQTVAHYLAPIKEYLEDVAVSEVMVNHADEIYIERDGKIVRVPAQFRDEEAYEAAVNNILQFTGQSFKDDKPLVDSRLPDGSRVHVAKSPCARFGTAMTIRKFSKAMLDLDWLIELGTLTAEANEYLRLIVRAERNLLVAGGTSSGKTSLLNALSRHIPREQRIVVIEDSAELQLQQDHVISMETKSPDQFGRGGVGIRELFRSSLRLRPDRIIIGEVRGGEALEMIQAMTSGHGGSMGTLHANNPQDALNRLETMALMSQVELPLHALRSQVSSALDVIVQMSRHIGGRRLVTQISEIDPLSEKNQYRLRDIFHLVTISDAKGDKEVQLQWTGERSALAGRLRPDEETLITEHTKKLFESA
jgi:pilus assembly protein CpaF